MDAEEMVTIAHALPTRVRLVAPRLAWHRDACERVARALAETRGVSRVTVRPPTGSVVVEGEPLSAEALRDALEALLRDARDEQGRPLVTEAASTEERPSATRLAHAVAHAAHGINADVRAALDARADLGTILPIVFAAAGVAQVGARREMSGPTWFNLFWWSLRSFMTFNFEAVSEEEGQPATTEGARRDAMGEV